jgi:hypothetical protein
VKGKPGGAIIGLSVEVDSNWKELKGIRLVRSKSESIHQNLEGALVEPQADAMPSSPNDDADTTRLAYRDVGDATADFSLIGQLHSIKHEIRTAVIMNRSTGAKSNKNAKTSYPKMVGGESRGMTDDLYLPNGQPVIGLLVAENSRAGYLQDALPVLYRNGDYPVMCPEGYGLAGLRVFADKEGVLGLQPIFMKIKGKKFDRNDRLFGKWLGKEPAQIQVEELGGTGGAVRGISTCQFSHLVNIGLLTED